MEIQGKKIILDSEEDYEFLKLINYIIKTQYGEIRLIIRRSKPRQIFELQKSILLSKDGTKKDSINYGD